MYNKLVIDSLDRETKKKRLFRFIYRIPLNPVFKDTKGNGIELDESRIEEYKIVEVKKERPKLLKWFSDYALQIVTLRLEGSEYTIKIIAHEFKVTIGNSLLRRCM